MKVKYLKIFLISNLFRSLKNLQYALDRQNVECKLWKIDRRNKKTKQSKISWDQKLGGKNLSSSVVWLRLIPRLPIVGKPYNLVQFYAVKLFVTELSFYT